MEKGRKKNVKKLEDHSGIKEVIDTKVKICINKSNKRQRAGKNLGGIN